MFFDQQSHLGINLAIDPNEFIAFGGIFFISSGMKVLTWWLIATLSGQTKGGA